MSSPVRNTVAPLSRRIAAVAFPLQPQRPTDALLRMLYGLTPAECRVALLLSDGRTPRRIAELVGVTGNTLRSQIKSIYSKTGVGRQAELVRLLLSYAEPRLDA